MRTGPFFWLFCLGSALAPHALAANLVVNGSFESPAAPADWFSTAIPTGWTALGNGSTTDIIHTGYSGAVASDGSQFVDLIGGGAGTLPSGLLQTLHLSGGQTYRLSFDYNGDGGLGGTLLEFALGSLVTGSIDVTSLNVYPIFGATAPWQSHAVDFAVATTGNYDLVFQSLSGLYEGPFIDDVSLVAVPDPASSLAGLACSTLGLLALRCWRRQDIRRPSYRVLA